MNVKKTLTSIAVSSALSAMISPQLLAQEAEDNLEVIQVKGIRGSILTAQEIKKNADTVKDVISADDIGALPDKSVTEALMRVPGVTIDKHRILQ